MVHERLSWRVRAGEGSGALARICGEGMDGAELLVAIAG
jgi:hypothetical protein